MNKIEAYLNDFTKEYFLVGSRALDGLYPGINCSVSGSDYDYIVLSHFANKIKSNLKENKIHVTDSHYNNGFKFSLGRSMVNIVPLDSVAYEAWKFGTKGLQSYGALSEKNAILLTDRDARIGMLEQLVSFYKMSNAMAGRYRSELKYYDEVYVQTEDGLKKGRAYECEPATVRVMLDGEVESSSPFLDNGKKYPLNEVRVVKSREEKLNAL